MTALYELTATEIVRRVRARELSAVDLVTALLERIARLEPEIEAWATLGADEALAEAAERDRAAESGQIGPLHGVPVGVKDIIDVAGMPTAAGFAPYRDRRADQDAHVVARLRAAGAIILGKVHTTQFAHADPAPTKNPWNAARTPGGSSAGSAAAVAAQMIPLALGTQTAGSVVRPAAYCGTVGFKPSYNWTSRDGVIPLAWSLDHVGLLARTVEDVALAYDALAGTQTDLAARRDTPPRLVLLTEFLERAEPDVRDHLLDVAERLRAAGATVVEGALPVDLDLCLAVHRVIMQAEVAAVHAEQCARHPDDYGKFLRQEIEVGQLIPAAYLLTAARLRRRIARAVDAALGEVDGYLLPSVSNAAPRRNTTGDRTFQAVWSLLGTPAITLPTGLNGDGLPIGTQLVARRGQDVALLALAAWCAQMLGTIAPPDLEPPAEEPEPEPAEQPAAEETSAAEATAEPTAPAEPAAEHAAEPAAPGEAAPEAAGEPAPSGSEPATAPAEETAAAEATEPAPAAPDAPGPEDADDEEKAEETPERPTES
ncbi:amidase [Sphaerobacter sp.]|uniref:amidase n=1 Tax=Sphaerobacter sp. TaxID=2099654 RepID=UPI001D5C7C55|nr:amidase [Sphaerobacter sp.]MBX5445962.1 amidase [Sphaerobacter sp.]